MKVVLINPCFKGIVATPSLGLGYLASYLIKKGYSQVKVIEPLLEGLNEAQVLKITKGCDLIGLVCYTESRFQCFDFARKVKEESPDCTIVIGGPHAAALDMQILKNYPFVDVIIRGEGEDALLDLVKGKPWEQISGITYRASSEIKKNPDRPLLSNLNALNNSFTSLIPGIAEWKDVEIPQTMQKQRSIPLIASRGCPYRCTFCASPKYWQGKWRGTTAQELANRVKYLTAEHEVDYFRFFDALFIGNEEEILNFCEFLEKENLKVNFRIDIRVGTSFSVLKRLRQAGCKAVGFGVESGSESILKRINKGITRAQIEETIKNCKKLGFWMIGYFMLALPDETKKDISKTLELLKYFDIVNLQFFKIHPHTVFYQELKELGEINDETWFDPHQGINTAYGNEFLYCRELFPSASFFKEEVERIIEKNHHNHYLSHPIAIFKTRGYREGGLKISISALSRIMLSSSIGANFYFKLKENLRNHIAAR